MVLAPDRYVMKRVMLVGRDPLFAWALERKLGPLGYHLEHVYTLAEARLRMYRFEYEAFLLDGLTSKEVEQFDRGEEMQGTIFVLGDVDESPPCFSRHIYFFRKETALSKLLPSFMEIAEKGHIPR